MKTKIKNLLGDYSRPNSRSHERVSYPRTKTRPGQQDQLDQQVWNNSVQRSEQYKVQKTQNSSLIGLIKENQELKLQIYKLQNQLCIYESFKKYSGPQFHLSSIPEQNLEQNERLKNILEKSYYSIKEMQKQIKKLTDEINFQRKSHDNTDKKLKIIIFEKDEAERKIVNLVSVHKEEIRLFNQRIQKLQSHIGHLLRLMQQDQKQWKRHMQDLNNFKKFSFKKTHQ